MCWVELEPAPWVHSHLAVATLWEGPAVTTPEMLVGANSSTHPESKQTVVTDVEPQEVTQEETGAVPLHLSQQSHGMGQIVTGLLSLAKGTGAVGTRLTHVDGNSMEKYQHCAKGVSSLPDSCSPPWQVQCCEAPSS